MIKTQKGLAPYDIVALTNDLRTEAWIQVGFPGYGELAQHVIFEEDSDIGMVIDEAVAVFIETNRKVEFSFEIDLPFEPTGDAEIDRLLTRAYGQPEPTLVDSLGDVLGDLKGNIGNAAEDLRTAFEARASNLRGRFKSRSRNA